jgi:DNA-binding GntR family transcriptional regulator
MSAVVKHDMALHRTIVQAGDKNDLVAIWLPIVMRMMLYYTRHEDLMESYREHEAIVEAIRKRNLEAAIKALEANIQ